METTLLIDGGQSGCRARYEPGGATARVRGLPRRGRDYAALRCLSRADLGVVAAGLTGFAGEIGAVAAAVPARRVIATNDAVTSHLGALGGEAGVVIVAGTGVIALAAGEDGAWARSDGHGSLLGDDGGGYWIGRAGLASALRAADGRGGSADLSRRAERFGAAARGIVAHVYDSADPVATIASFARDVADAARDGDAVALRIIEEAARELAATALAAARKAGVAGGPFSYAGGLFAAGDLLLEPLRDALPGLRPPLGDALDGAARLLDRPTLFSDLIHETGDP
jgi:N-acetylglucosamine kinase-like BadF-type ATPase